jgi:tetratricopeptide (TPR) repeat protein
VGNYFFNQGNYRDAETNYVALSQSTNWPRGEITYQAGLAAGRAAFKRQTFKQAAEYFKTVIVPLSDATNRWPDLLAMAYFAYGDNFCADAPSDKTNAVSKYAAAITAFEKIPDTNRLAPQAWGRIADCHMQLGSDNTNRYTKAIEFYTKAMDTNVADIDIRSNAQVGLGLVYEKLAADTNQPPAVQAALMEKALSQYLEVVFTKVLRPGEKPVPFWVQRAGLDAGRLYGAQGKWTEVVKLYEYLLKVLPASAKSGIERKLDYAKKQAG